MRWRSLTNVQSFLWLAYACFINAIEGRTIDSHGLNRFRRGRRRAGVRYWLYNSLAKSSLALFWRAILINVNTVLVSCISKNIYNLFLCFCVVIIAVRNYWTKYSKLLFWSQYGFWRRYTYGQFATKHRNNSIISNNWITIVCSNITGRSITEVGQYGAHVEVPASIWVNDVCRNDISKHNIRLINLRHGFFCNNISLLCFLYLLISEESVSAQNYQS